MLHKLDETYFKNVKVNITHVHNTGHIYIRPYSNLLPFSDTDECEILEVLGKLGIGAIKQNVKRDFTTEPIKAGYGFRLYSL